METANDGSFSSYIAQRRRVGWELCGSSPMIHPEIRHEGEG